ncbi:MAG: hypothetical protein ACYT04_79920, partial [Nostoc sp.]
PSLPKLSKLNQNILIWQCCIHFTSAHEKALVLGTGVRSPTRDVLFLLYETLRVACPPQEYAVR